MHKYWKMAFFPTCWRLSCIGISGLDSALIECCYNCAVGIPVPDSLVPTRIFVNEETLSKLLPFDRFAVIFWQSPGYWSGCNRQTHCYLLYHVEIHACMITCEIHDPRQAGGLVGFPLLKNNPARRYPKPPHRSGSVKWFR